jgi:hypothetical protein
MMADKIKVLFKAPFADYSGYATIARNLLIQLYKLDKFDLYLEPIVWINSGNLELPEEEKKIIDELLAKSVQIDPTDKTLIHFSIATEFFGEKSPFRKTIGFTMIETDKTANGWAWKCNQMDAVFVPSTFCLGSFMQSNVSVPIRVVPFGIDFEKYTPEGEKLLDLPTKFNFLTVGQWLPQGDRKNIIGVLQTFLHNFRNNPDVGLILKTYHVGAGTVDKLQIENSIQQIRQQVGIKNNEGPQIYLVHGAMSEENMIKLYRNADVFLLPTCGEAWGMPLMEAAAMGLPIITTRGTGAEAFLNEEHVVMVDAEWKPIGNRIYWPHVYEHYQQLLIPNMEEFARMVHRVYKYPEMSREQAKKQRLEMIERGFTWKAAAEQLAEAIEDLNDAE